MPKSLLILLNVLIGIGIILAVLSLPMYLLSLGGFWMIKVMFLLTIALIMTLTMSLGAKKMLSVSIGILLIILALGWYDSYLYEQANREYYRKSPQGTPTFQNL